MTQEANNLLKKTLTLPAEDRAAVAGSLLDSLEEPIDPSAEEAWNQEITRRIADLDSGKAKRVPWGECAPYFGQVQKNPVSRPVASLRLSFVLFEYNFTGIGDGSA